MISPKEGRRNRISNYGWVGGGRAVTGQQVDQIGRGQEREEDKEGNVKRDS